jgi:ABC-type Fe3+ transport system permease subunit
MVMRKIWSVALVIAIMITMTAWLVRWLARATRSQARQANDIGNVDLGTLRRTIGARQMVLMAVACAVVLCALFIAAEAGLG